ncbi:MAG: tyrosine-type recombinase/integrase [Enterocloster clostridioformis]
MLKRFTKIYRPCKSRTSRNVSGKRYTPHTMRHTTATHMLEAGVPIVAIKNFLGHSSISTTERYAELSQEL